MLTTLSWKDFCFSLRTHMLTFSERERYRTHSMQTVNPTPANPLFLSCRWSRWIRGAASSERHHEDLEHQLHAELGLAAGRCRDPRRHLHHAICAVSLRITRAGLIYLSDGGHRGRGPPHQTSDRKLSERLTGNGLRLSHLFLILEAEPEPGSCFSSLVSLEFI